MQTGIASLRWSLLCFLALIVASSAAAAACIDPVALAHSTMSIMRHFDDKELEKHPGLLGIRGTGWFLSPTSIVTVEHVAAAMNLTGQDWKQVEIGSEDNTQPAVVRVQRIAGTNREKIAVLELQTPFSSAQSLQLRAEAFVAEEPVVSLAYPHSHLRVVGGRFVQYGDGERLAGTALLEMYDGDDRLVLDHGASGAPVFDCAGRVGAVVANLFTTTIQFMSVTTRVSTAWGSPNVVSVPVPVLRDVSRAE
jgi:hypothetical protein